ncbi:unnamed protein product, partial [Brassica rapa subsp. trilocularis]
MKSMALTSATFITAMENLIPANSSRKNKSIRDVNGNRWSDAGLVCKLNDLVGLRCAAKMSETFPCHYA